MVECGSEFIRFSFKTVKPFRGKVFVKGQHGNDDCSRDYSEITSIYTSHIEGKILIKKFSNLKTYLISLSIC